MRIFDKGKLADVMSEQRVAKCMERETAAYDKLAKSGKRFTRIFMGPQGRYVSAKSDGRTVYYSPATAKFYPGALSGRHIKMSAEEFIELID